MRQPGKKALICGVSGQDGGYPAQLLSVQGYQVAGHSRDARTACRESRKTLGRQDRDNMQQVATLMIEDGLRHLKVHGA